MLQTLDESPSTILKTTHNHLRAITELTRLFEGKIVDVSGNSVAVELCAKPERISSFMKLCKPFGIIECSRTGTNKQSKYCSVLIFSFCRCYGYAPYSC